MEIKNIDINSIIPYEFNNRIHEQKQINLIANSINEFGFNQPIVIDESNIVLVGHGRLLAAQKLKLKQIPVLQLKNLTEAKKRAYRILDNKLQNDSEWSLENLDLELEALQEDGFDLEAWGLEDLLITPDLLGSKEIPGEDRETNFSRNFVLTKEQSEKVDEAVKRAATLHQDEGNKNGAAISLICVEFLRNL